ncbi:hypothetical protein Vafri_16210 [Volvox africanus]|uniref:Uncharacterized protein n=1 Tax=Volvox africanus TaxID=51714 RepID=A0A8J4BJI4_9CHLO|nr:hypothetical protein Vafri_16210 [Volvox africanus]
MMLRPVGTCLLPDTPPPTGGEGGSGDAPSAADTATRVALILPPYSRHLENTFIMPWLLRNGLTAHVQVYRQHYGGPAVLARHRGVITVPYQTSVMKMYEGLAAGAVFIIPSPELFATLVRELDLHRMSFCCRELLRDHPDDWPHFMDWYHPDFVSAHVLYDNLKDLKRFLTDIVTFVASFIPPKSYGNVRSSVRLTELHSSPRPRLVLTAGFGEAPNRYGSHGCLTGTYSGWLWTSPSGGESAGVRRHNTGAAAGARRCLRGGKVAALTLTLTVTLTVTVSCC